MERRETVGFIRCYVKIRRDDIWLNRGAPAHFKSERERRANVRCFVCFDESSFS